MLNLSNTGKIVRWQQGGQELLVRPRRGEAGGANLYLTHRGMGYLRQDYGPYLERTQHDADLFTGEVGHETDPNLLWRYHVELSVTEDHNFITNQVTLERKLLWPHQESMPVTVGYMLRFATEGRYARLLMDGVELASTKDVGELEYDHRIHLDSAISKNDDIVVETAYGRFILTAVSGVDGIVLDTTVPERYFGVMLTGGAFAPIMVEPLGSFVQTTSVRFEPHLR